MSVPVYSDFSKSFNDLISKDFPVGSTKLEVITTTPNGVKFTVLGSKNHQQVAGGIDSSVKAKFTDKARGLTLTETWTGANVLTAQCELADVMKGLKLDLTGTLAPNSGSKAAKFGAEFKQDISVTRATLDLLDGPTVSADSVFRFNDFIVGGDVTYGVAKESIQKFGAGIGYLSPLFSTSLMAGNKFTTITAGFYQKVNSDLEAGCKAVYNKGSSNVRIEVAAKLAMDNDSFVKAKVDNEGFLGLSYTHSLRQGFKVAVGALFDATRLDTSAHKVGLHMTFES